jgi:hypothetical protein
MSAINLAQLLYRAYPDTDLLPIDPQTDLKDLDALFRHYQTIKEDGEDLFRAVMEEMWDVTHGVREEDRIPVALSSLERVTYFPGTKR